MTALLLGSWLGVGCLGGVAAAQAVVTVDPANPTWLEYSDGSTFFLCAPGEPEGFLYRGTRNANGSRTGDQAALIAKLAPTGANGIYLIAVRSHGGDGGPTENPWIGSDPAKGLDLDILAQWESWFTQMDNTGITIFFIFYDDGADPFGGDLMSVAESLFVGAIVDRFKHHRNLIWTIAEEFQEDFSVKRVAQLAATIRTRDPLHPIASHQLTGLVFRHADDPNIDQFAVQVGSSSPSGYHNAAVTAWNNARGRYNLNFAEPHRGTIGTGTDARKKIWSIMMGGAYVMPIDWDIAGTPIARLRECGRAVDFLEAVELDGMAPHDELAHGSTLYVLAKPGDRYVVYGSAGGSPGIKSMVGGTYSLHWLDTIDGDIVRQTRSVGSGDRIWTRPGAIGPEFALYVDRQTITGSLSSADTGSTLMSRQGVASPAPLDGDHQRTGRRYRDDDP